MSKMEEHSLSQHLETGLTQEQVDTALQKYGLNQVRGKKPPSDLYFLLNQFKNPLIFVLLVATAITALIGHFSDAFVIALAVGVNTLLGFIQERKAFKSLEALKTVVSHKTFVIRDGTHQEVDVTTLVPGDVVLVFEGDKIPADGVIIENNDVLIEEAILTGESMPVDKSVYTLPVKTQTVAELVSQASHSKEKTGHESQTFMGTIVVSGSAKLLITQTGMNTQLGTIAANIEENQETNTPLEKKLDTLAKFITITIIILCVFIFTVGVVTMREPVEMFVTAVAIAVSAIPEGLVVGLTAILAIGMHKILQRKGLVRNLMAAETLGSVTMVCVDKTGTLTEGKMRVSDIKTEHESLLYLASTLANDRKDPIEIARWNWAQKISANNKNFISPEQLILKYKRTASIPFSVERRFLAVQIEKEIFLSGAPEEMLQRSTVSAAEKDKYNTLIHEWSSQGKRLIGFGYIKSKTNQEATTQFAHLKKNKKTSHIEWLGLIAFDDPIRTSVAETFAKTQEAGINLKVITGDYSATALFVLKQIGINIAPSQFMEGNEVESLSVTQLQKRVNEIILFARTKPSHKLKIVTALKNNGEIVAMMGDGVNDAPALAKADIGIVVENASEVAKESSELILLDSNMNTIVAAIEEGRAMFDNLRKVTLYLLSDSLAEIIIILVNIMMGTPLALTAAQILWINLVDDGLPNLALTIDPRDPDILKRKPLSRSAKIITKEMFFLILLISGTSAISCLILFLTYLPTEGLAVARTISFATLGIVTLLYVYSCKSLEKPFWHGSLWNNKPLILSSLFGIVLTVLSVYLPPLQTLLSTTALRLDHWLVVGVVSVIIVTIIEGFKWLWHILRKKMG